MTKLIFAVSGKKKSGKTTLVSHLMNNIKELPLPLRILSSSFGETNFADSFKHFFSEYFEIPLQYFYDEVLKDSPTQYQWKDIPPYNKEYQALRNSEMAGFPPINYTEQIKFYYKFLTVRDFMQTVGDDILGTIFPKIWINKTIRVIKHLLGEFVFIPDFRFKKEAVALDAESAFKVVKIRLTRYVPQNERNDKHISETDLDDYAGFDHVIDNQNLTLEQAKRQFRDIVMAEIKKYDKYLQ